MKNFYEFLKIIKKLEDSEGYKIDNILRDLDFSFKVMTINYGYLKKYLDNIPIFSIEQRNEKEKFQINTLRLLANFLNTSQAFVDHVRRCVKKLYKDYPKEKNNYKSEVKKRFINNDLSQFIEYLRNFYSHYNILPVGIIIRVNNRSKMYGRAFLDRDMLMESSYNKNDKKGSSFLKKANKNIDILDICKTYIEKNIIVWLIQEQSEIHKEIFKETKKIKKKAKKFYKQ